MNAICTSTGPWAPFLAAMGAANGSDLPAMPEHVAQYLAAASTEFDGSGAAAVVGATRWRWVADGLHGTLTLQRSDADGEVWELVCTIAAQPGGLVHTSSVVRWTTEGRQASGLGPVGQFWLPSSELRPTEIAALTVAAAEALADPPPHQSFRRPEAGLTKLRLDALGIEGELCVVTDLRLAYVRATAWPATTSPDAAARALQAAVLEQHAPVPAWIDQALTDGLPLLAVVGGDL